MPNFEQKAYPFRIKSHPREKLIPPEKTCLENEYSELLSKHSGLNLSDFKNWKTLCGSDSKAHMPVTVIVPAWREPQLESTLTRVTFSQIPNEVPLHIISVLDGSDEATIQSARDFAVGISTDDLLERHQADILSKLEERIDWVSNTHSFSACHANIKYDALIVDRQGKASAVKKAIEMYASTRPNIIVLDADCVCDPQAIPLLHIGMARYPEVELASSRKVLAFDSSTYSLGKNSCLPATAQEERRVHGGLYAVTPDLFKTMPNNTIREDYFLEISLQLSNNPWLYVPESIAYDISPSTAPERAFARIRMDIGAEQIVRYFGLSSNPEEDQNLCLTRSDRDRIKQRLPKIIKTILNPSEIKPIAYYSISGLWSLALYHFLKSSTKIKSAMSEGIWDSPQRGNKSSD